MLPWRQANVPLRDDLLNPIAGDNPSGKSLRYERVYDQIKEARTEDDESIPTGDWQRQAKRADFALVIKQAGEALATRSKDLQLLAWLTEAHIKREGMSLLDPCLQMFLKMQQEFWETLYPEIEDGDVGMRAVPVEWMANRAATLLREAPLTSSKLNFYEYKESRSIGYEADAANSEAKAAARELAIADGKVTAEDFDTAVVATPKSFYVGLEGSLDSSLESLETLQQFSEEKYGDDGPSFSKLRSAIEEVRQVVSALLNEKRRTEPDEGAEAEPEEVVEETAVEQEGEAVVATQAAPKKGKALSAEPADWDDAVARVNACAAYMRTQNAYSPIPYLLQMAVRWGELREQGSSPSYDFLVSPATEVRQKLKRLAAESNWEELLAAALAAAGAPCGRAWLDVQRYIWTASYNGGYSALAETVIASLRSLLRDIPETRHWTLDDDTPTANPETQQWLDEMVVPKPAEIVRVETATEAELEPVEVESGFSMDMPAPEEEGEVRAPDAYELAEQFMRQGQVESAIQLLARDAAQQPSGRMRFQRRMQVAQLCMAAGLGEVAHPMLEQLAREMEQRKLDEWEAGEILAQPLALLLKCMEKTSNGTADRAAIFARLCHIDPAAAIHLSR